MEIYVFVGTVLSAELDDWVKYMARDLYTTLGVEVTGIVVKTVPQIFIAQDYKYTHIGGYKEIRETLK